MTRISTTLVLLLLAIISFAQKKSFYGTPFETRASHPALAQQFEAWDLYRMDVKAVNSFVKNGGQYLDFQLQFGGQYAWDISMQPRDMRSPNFKLSLLTDKGVEHPAVPSEVITFQGQLKGNEHSSVSLTITDNLIYGFIKIGEEFYFVEPLRYFEPDQPEDLFVVYPASKVKPREGSTCGFDEMKKHMHQHGAPEKNTHNGGTAEAMMMGCKEIELAQASDLSMFAKHGAAVGAHMLGVMLNVQTNYDDEFNDELQFAIVEQFIVMPPASNPWTSSTDAVELLEDFTDWGPTGFSNTHDLGQLWTNRNFDGSTIGIAWLSAVCTSIRYHCLQDFTSNANLLRVMTAHEIGHNFSATHDASGSPTIMAPSVGNVNQWSAQSLNQINGYYPTRNCLANCSSGLPPVAAFAANPTSGCAPLTVNFTDLSINTPFSWSWSFPGGTPSTSTLQNPTVVYPAAGTYDVSLTVENGAGSNSITQSSLITVEEAPMANFTWAQTGLTVIFTDLSSPNTNSWFWQFGDGAVSTSQNPIHTYSVDGFYDVILEVTGDCGSTVFIVNIPVFTPPTAAISGTPTTGCAPLQVQFSSAGTPNATTWLWSFQGGNPAVSTQENPLVNYNTPGTYDVTLTVTNPAGSDAITLNDFVVVGTVATPSFTYNVNGSTVAFTNTTNNSQGIGAVSYLWNFGDGNTSTATNPSHTYANGGDYTVTLTATNNCGATTTTQIVTISTPPTAGFTANVTSGCPTLTVAFDNTSSANATSFNWSFPGGSPSSSTAENPTVEYATPGTYNVTLIASNSAGADTLTLNNYITVHPLATAGFTSSVNGLTASFTNTSSNANSYTWNFGDGNTSTATNPVHTYAEDGVYTVVLTATNNCGNATSTQTVTIVTPPTAAFSANVTSGCAPLTVQFSNQSSENATSFQWSFPGGTPSSSTLENPTVTYNAAGSYNVMLTVSNAAGSNSVTQTAYINISATATAGFTYSNNNGTVNFTNTSSNANSYSWNFGDGNTSTLANPSHTYQEDGTYTVTLSATNACGTVTATQTITIVMPPVAGFSANSTSGCASLTVQFNNESSENASSYAWEFPGASPATSTAENPSVTYSTPGTYSVMLTVTNSAGSNTFTQNNYITVNGVPNVGFDVNTNVNLASFNNTTTGGATSYAWNFGDGGTSSLENPSHTYPGDGTYTVTLTATNTCGTSTATESVVITSLPVANFAASSTNGCAPFTVQFADQSSSNATAWAWNFPGGSPSSSTEQNPSVTYNLAGAYTVSLTVENALGENTLTQTNYITVGTVPTAGFTNTTNLLTANFNNSSSNATSYTWDFGDGNTSNGASPSHTYGEDGTYTVTLTATNNCGNVVATQTVTVASLPTAGFSANTTGGCAPFTVQFTNESSENATSFQWNFPGGTPSSSNAENPSVTYQEAGSYTVTLTVSNAAGTNSVTETNFITVDDVPATSFNATVDELTVDFNNMTQNATSYAWDFGDGTSSNEENPVHTYGQDGTYEVTLTATNGCGSATMNGQFTVATPPTAAFSALNTKGCAPFEVQFANESSANSATFAWEFPGGTPSTSSEENPVVAYNAAGSYSVTLTVSNVSGSDVYELTNYITVEALPAVSFTASANNNSVSFTNTSTGANSYLWDFGDGTTSTEQNPTHEYSSEDAFTVILTATNDCGSATTEEIVVVASEQPIAAFQATTTAGCAPFIVQFENLSSVNATSFEWTFPGGSPATSTEENPEVKYELPGVYDVTLVASNGIGNDTYSQTAYITVNSTPSASYTYVDNGGTLNFTNGSTNATSYEWNFGDGTTSNEENPTHTYTSNGEFEVTLTATNECGFASSTQSIEVLVNGLGEIPGITGFNLFPNPNGGQFTMTLQGQAQKALEISFTNILGQRLMFEQVDFNSGSLSRQFAFDCLAAGVYVLKVKSGENAIFRKVVIE
jgi:PKD repeat protein